MLKRFLGDAVDNEKIVFDVPPDPHGIFVSYAQNFEDLTLWRALRLFGPGYYVDVGANDPDHFSVTKSLYLRGWRGLNVEPIRRLHEALSVRRPEDVNLRLAIASKVGSMEFHEISVSGWSTLDAGLADMHKAQGHVVTTYQVEVQTLDLVCEKHLKTDKPFHFLKIDVEGLEREVLGGFDLLRWRPWIVIVESSVFHQPAWLSMLTDVGYLFSHSDGINRYFVHPEMAALKAPLRMPPNVMDNFRLCEGHPLGAQVPSLGEHFVKWLKSRF